MLRRGLDRLRGGTARSGSSGVALELAHRRCDAGDELAGEIVVGDGGTAVWSSTNSYAVDNIATYCSLAYPAAGGDVYRGRVFGRCDTTTGIAAFTALVDQVMSQEPYASATRVFWIVDNGSSHRGQAAIDRLAEQYTNAIMIHTPVHASWLNQVEIYFSIIQRKVLSPNDFADLTAVERRLLVLNANNADRHPVQMEIHHSRSGPAPPTTRSTRTRHPSRMTPDELETRTRPLR